MDFTPGSSVREILDAAGVRIRSGCRGNGACGLCLVRIDREGDNAGPGAGPTGDTPETSSEPAVNPPTKNERILLTPGRIERNIRLACQLTPKGDISVRIVGAACDSGWRVLAPGPCSLASSSNPRPPLSAGKTAAPRHGLAVDLGTTHISMSLWDLEHAARLSGRAGLNPQGGYGSDVVTRMLAAAQSPENARRLAWAPLHAVNEALLDMCAQNGVDPRTVTRVAFVGNTAMLMLLTETDPGVLLRPQSWTKPVVCKCDDLRSWAPVLGVHPRANVEVVPPIAGFVGSDLAAGVTATRLTDRPGGLLIDFGTNSEIALWDGDRLWVTSAAGGPAFEGSGMQCGMPAEPGAVFRVERERDFERDSDRDSSAGLRLEVIGGGEAGGLCGSGMVDLIACLRGAGRLTATGKFAGPPSRDGFIVQREPMIRLTHGDVDIFQRAKAAIGVGIKSLLAAARMSAADLTRVCVCGAFGEHLNVRNARDIGLLPAVPPDRVELCGNTALAGCERLLLSPEGAADLESLRRSAAVINLSRLSDFEDLFLEALYLEPLRTDRT